MMKTSVSHPLLAFIIVIYSLTGAESGWASPLKRAVQNPKDGGSGTLVSLPYRVEGHIYYPLKDSSGFTQEGIASWYGREFHGKPTSNRETYNMFGLTAAHKTLPFNAWVGVTHLETGKTIKVRINDRGPFVGNRIIDLSYSAAKNLGMLEKGTAPVRIRVLEVPGTPMPPGSALRPSVPDRYSVQVGVFSNQDNAKKVSQKFRDSRVEKIIYRLRPAFKVLVGKFSKFENALSLMDRIRLRGFAQAFIVSHP